MNAKMVITVPIDKIPIKVSSLLDDITLELDEILHDTRELINNNNQLERIEKIDAIRKRLSLIDLNYEDCYSVLLGYTKYESDKRIKELSPEQEQSNGNQSNG